MLCSLEAPHQGASDEYPQHTFLCRNKKKYFWLDSRAVSSYPVMGTAVSCLPMITITGVMVLIFCEAQFLLINCLVYTGADGVGMCIFSWPV